MDVVALAAAGMQDDGAKLQRIAQNLSNVSTPGFKRQMADATRFATQFDAIGMVAGAPQPASRSPLIDPRAGTLRGTGLATDLAIEGEGFFELAGPDGPLYTRRGEFRVDAAGRLVGPGGLPVAGNGGDIRLSGTDFRIDGNGDVRQGGVTVARLNVVLLEHPERLESAGASSYALGGAVLAGPLDSPKIRVGFLENANVDSATEMVSLTDTVRHFESLQKIVQGYDEILEKSIRKLGEF